jgi:hypothetical protein
MPSAAACAISSAVGKLRRRQCVPCSDPCASARSRALRAVSYARAASTAVVCLEGAGRRSVGESGGAFNQCASCVIILKLRTKTNHQPLD